MKTTIDEVIAAMEAEQRRDASEQLDSEEYESFLNRINRENDQWLLEDYDKQHGGKHAIQK